MSAAASSPAMAHALAEDSGVQEFAPDDPHAAGPRPDAGENARTRAEGWVEALATAAAFYGMDASRHAMRLSARWSDDEDMSRLAAGLARKAGLRLRFAPVTHDAVTSWRTPMIVQLQGGQTALITHVSADGQAELIFSGDDGLRSAAPVPSLIADAQFLAVVRPARAVPDARVDAYIRPWRKNWLRALILPDIRPYGHVMLASLVANTLALAGVIFSMQVYDRVVPAQSMPTLYVLFAGVMIALLFDFILRRMRMGIVDILGKQADVRMSDTVFGHALRVRTSARPASTGSFIARLRDLEQVREMMTSTTVTALADLPFFLLFLGVFFYIGGPLVIVPLVALVLLIVPSVLAQKNLRRYATEAMREASMRNAILVEAVQGMEDIKTLQAEERFQRLWRHCNSVTADSQVKLRRLTNGLSVWTHTVQTGVFACVVVMGAPMVIAGDMTTGALVGASILGSRMMAPMGQLTQVLSRMQQAKIGAESLDGVMKLPVDHPDAETRIAMPAAQGGYVLKDAVFGYGEEAPPALTVQSLRIQPGDRIAVLGRNGAGKSTLLQALSGLMEPSSGEILLDGLALGQIDPADVRREVGLLTQNARLFHGTLRENILLGAPDATDAELLEALRIAGADAFVRRLPRGLDHMVQEGGLGLSGGQRQSVLLARTLVRCPTVMLLDEPTAAMDDASERNFIAAFDTWAGDRTIVVATHRMRVLELATRVIVVENGRISLDDGKDVALARLSRAARIPERA